MSPSVLWFFGLPSAGKSTIATSVRERLAATGKILVVLDGDDLRSGLCADLGFSDAERSENLRRAAEVAKILATQNIMVICAFITPREHHRKLVRDILGPIVRLIHVNCPLDVCIDRDVKGLYRKASQNAIKSMTGTQDVFDTPTDIDGAIDSHKLSVAASVEVVVKLLS